MFDVNVRRVSRADANAAPDLGGHVADVVVLDRFTRTNLVLVARVGPGRIEVFTSAGTQLSGPLRD